MNADKSHTVTAKILYLNQDFKYLKGQFFLSLNVLYNTALRESTATPLESVPAKKKQHINLRESELFFFTCPIHLICLYFVKLLNRIISDGKIA